MESIHHEQGIHPMLHLLGCRQHLMKIGSLVRNAGGLEGNEAQRACDGAAVEDLDSSPGHGLCGYLLRDCGCLIHLALQTGQCDAQYALRILADLGVGLGELSWRWDRGGGEVLILAHYSVDLAGGDVHAVPIGHVAEGYQQWHYPDGVSCRQFGRQATDAVGDYGDLSHFHPNRSESPPSVEPYCIRTARLCFLTSGVVTWQGQPFGPGSPASSTISARVRPPLPVGHTSAADEGHL